MTKFIWTILLGLFGIVLVVLFIPIAIFMFFSEIFLGLFHIPVRDSKGNLIKSWTDNQGLLGLAILSIPLIILILYMLVMGVMYIYFLMSEYCSSGSFILITLAVIIPIIGICLVSAFLMKGNN